MDVKREPRCEICGKDLSQVKCLNMFPTFPRKKWNISCVYEDESISIRIVCNDCLSKYYSDESNDELWQEAYEWMKREYNPSIDSFTDEEFLRWIRRLETKKLMELSLILKGEIECLTKTCFGRELEEMIFKDLQEVIKTVTLEILRFVKGKYFTMSFNNMEELNP